MSKADKTKAFILDKIATVFNRKGYAGTSLTDMVEATGLTKGSIYGNFSNKDDLALAAFDHNLAKMLHIFKTEISRHQTARNQLLSYGQVYTHYSKYPFPDGGCPLLNTATEADDTHPALRKKAKEALTSWKNSIALIVRKGIENNEFTKASDPERIALTIIALLEGGMMISRLTERNIYPSAVLISIKKTVDDISL